VPDPQEVIVATQVLVAVSTMVPEAQVIPCVAPLGPPPGSTTQLPLLNTVPAPHSSTAALSLATQVSPLRVVPLPQVVELAEAPVQAAQNSARESN